MGFPVAKASKVLYKNNQKRVDGYKVFHETIKNGLDSNSISLFFGSNEKVITLMIKKLKEEYHDINIVGYKCPPVKTYEELCQKEFVDDMIQQNADISLGVFRFSQTGRVYLHVKKQNTIYIQILLELEQFLSGLLVQK